VLDNGSLTLNSSEPAKDEWCPSGSARNSLSLFFKGRRLPQYTAHYGTVTRNFQDKAGLVFHTRNIPSFPTLDFHCCWHTLSMYCYCTMVRSFREVSSDAEPGNHSPPGDSTFWPGGIAFSTYLVECVST